MKLCYLIFSLLWVTCSYANEIKFQKSISTPSVVYSKNKKLSDIIELEYKKVFMSTKEDMFPEELFNNGNIDELSWDKLEISDVYQGKKVYLSDAYFVSELDFEGKKKIIFRVDDYDVWLSSRYLGEKYKTYITKDFVEDKEKIIDVFKEFMQKRSQKTEEFKQLFSSLAPYSDECSFGCAYTKHQIFNFENNYYFLYRRVDTVMRKEVYDNHVLHLLNPDGTSQSIAEFEVYPKQQEKIDLPMMKALGKCLFNIYGERDNAGTTMAYEYRLGSYEEVLEQIKNKPWIVVNKKPYKRCDNYENDPEPFLENWSYMDHWNYREYGALQYHIKSTKYELENFYKNNYGLNEIDAEKTADCSTKSLIQTLIRTSGAISYSKDSIDTLKTDFNKTSLMYSAHMNNYERTKKLLQSGENINAKTTVAYRSKRKMWHGKAMIYNRTPLMYAAENSSIEIIKLLVENGADVSAVDTEDRTISDYLKLNPYLTDEDKLLSISHLIEKYSQDNKLFKPSFDCKRANTKIEKRICENKSLAIYDRELSNTYMKLKEISSDRDYDRRDMLAWQRERQKDCGKLTSNNLDTCLIEKYRAKTRYLLQRFNMSRYLKMSH